jgi:NADPH:quinone reductase-like Zn-dependent oxidoreductase
MKAWLCRRYGGPDVVELAEVPRPVPKDDEILIKIQATTVTSADWRIRSLTIPRGFGSIARLAFGFTRPRQPILGTECAGTVEAISKSVTRFKPGDAVVAFSGGKQGCHAQYRTMPESGPIAAKPETLSFEEAASLCFGGTTALHFLRKAGIKPGDKVLVIGASGNVGTAIVQLAKHFGAEVTGVTSTANRDLVASLGATEVIDYTTTDYTASSETYDIIADTVGASTFDRCKPILRPNGRYLAIAGDLTALLAASFKPKADSKRILAGPAPESAEDVRQLAEWAASGVLRPVIDKVYEFSQMREAHAHVATGRKKGSVVVRVSHD